MRINYYHFHHLHYFIGLGCGLRVIHNGMDYPHNVCVEALQELWCTNSLLLLKHNYVIGGIFLLTNNNFHSKITNHDSFLVTILVVWRA